VSTLIALGVCALYVFLVVVRPRICATLVFAAFAWLAVLEGVRGSASGSAYCMCCGLLFGGMPLACGQTGRPARINRA